MKKLIIANWKMNPQTLGEAKRLFGAVAKSARRLKNVETVLCPPFVYLEGAGDMAQGGKLVLGGQDCYWEERGAYTGEVSPKMLKSLGASYVIIGHSERRRHLGETDEMVNKKVLVATRAGLKVILCIGETLAKHQRGQTNSVLRSQLRKDLKGLGTLGRGFTVAYEPIWAIGTGLPETPANADLVAKFIRGELGKLFSRKIAQGTRIIYGGSVNSKNIVGYLGMSEIVGALVGGASLVAKDFSKILRIANDT